MKQLWFLRRNREPLRWLFPATGGGVMLVASVLPWLKDPLGDAYSAWNLRIELGWQVFGIPPTIFTGFFSYGMLCAGSALYAFLVAYANWKPFRGSGYFVGKHSTAALLCALPAIVFCLQYLCIDMPFMAHLAQREGQLLLIQIHFGYGLPAQRVPINPLTLDISSFQQRFILLLDQVSFGLFGPCIGCWMLLDHQRWFAVRPYSTRTNTTKRRRPLLTTVGVLALLVLFGRAPIAMLCETQAVVALAAGNYPSTLQWLDVAKVFNPLLNDVAYYHKERGQALYFLHDNDEQNDDSRIYLAFAYRDQGNLVEAYQQLLAIWKLHRSTSWLMDEMDNTLERLAENGTLLRVQPQVNINAEGASLQWLQMLAQVNPDNVYGRYSIGRIDYELHDYTDCGIQMARVLVLSSNQEVQSSAYTYMGLSKAGQGNYIASRELLLQAVKLDPYYRNNVAREELSGLR